MQQWEEGGGKPKMFSWSQSRPRKPLIHQNIINRRRISERFYFQMKQWYSPNFKVFLPNAFTPVKPQKSDSFVLSQKVTLINPNMGYYC